MKKAILNEEVLPHITGRIASLEPDIRPVWGHFSVDEMMFHCATINDAVLQNKQNSHTPTLKQHFMRTLVLKGMNQLPKGIRTNPKYLKPKEEKPMFEETRKRLLASVSEVVYRKEDIYGTHPLLGPLNTLQWRRFMYMHLDHHLRQFNA